MYGYSETCLIQAYIPLTYTEYNKGSGSQGSSTIKIELLLQPAGPKGAGFTIHLCRVHTLEAYYCLHAFQLVWVHSSYTYQLPRKGHAIYILDSLGYFFHQVQVELVPCASLKKKDPHFETMTITCKNTLTRLPSTGSCSWTHGGTTRPNSTLDINFDKGHWW